MAYRKKVNQNRSKKLFSRTAKSTKAVNINPKVARGGIRL